MRISAAAPLAAALILAAAATSAEAQQRRAAAPKNAAAVTVTNARAAPLQDLELTSTGNPPVVAAKLAKPLEPGKSIRLAIKGKHGCVFNVAGSYADEATVENDGIDLCKDGKLRLSE